MAQVTISRRGSIKGLSEAISMLEGLAKDAKSKPYKDAVEQMQGRAFEMINSAVYHTKYGTSLATIFRKKRPRIKDGSRSKMYAKGTPYLSGRLQRTLITPDSPGSIYKQKVLKGGGISVTYGGDPKNPYNGYHYFSFVENMYGFFEQGLMDFERAQTVKKLSKDLASLFSRKILDNMVKRMRRSTRRG